MMYCNVLTNCLIFSMVPKAIDHKIKRGTTVEVHPLFPSQ